VPYLPRTIRCEWCDKVFETWRPTARFCCDAHRHKWHNDERRRLAELGRQTEQATAPPDQVE
jgi:hypothetical protein